jgi:hypothetical protein
MYMEKCRIIFAAPFALVAAECRQDKRDDKQQGREKARDIKY